jgi:N6-adenosine-specific RNA methylase IME4
MKRPRTLPAVVDRNTGLVFYEAARRALGQAHRVDEVKDIRDRAVAFQTYAKQAKDETLIKQATEIRMRAERRSGELLIEMGERGERQKPGDNPRGVNSRTAQPLKPKLADLGINKTESSRWQALARIPEDKFERNIERASTAAYNRMTQRFVKELEIENAQQRHQNLIEQGCTVDDLVALAASGKRFPVIYADPPWPWETFGPLGRIRSCADHHYGLSPIDEIKALPVGALAADDCVLLLWGTWPRLLNVVEVIAAWGFTYKTLGFVWVKTTKDAEFVNLDGDGLHTGMGYWTRSNSEFCLLATKGEPMRLMTDVHEVVLAPVGEHSAKPEEVRRRIERLLPGPYLELYGRKPVDRWHVWGNEIKRADFPQYSAADSGRTALKQKGRTEQ